MSKTLVGKYAEKLEKENKQLKEIKDKAIEYIKNYDKNSNDLIFTMRASDELLEKIDIGGFCELKKKCDEGLCDCTNEEYNSMAECNMKLSLENQELKEKIDRAISFIYLLKNNVRDYKTKYKEIFLNMLDDIGNILRGKE